MPRNANQSKFSNYSMDFDSASSDKITGTGALISGNEPRSFSLWYKTTLSTPMIPFSLGNPDSTLGGTNTQFAYCINRQNSTTRAAIFGRGNDVSPITVPATNDGNWHHLVVTYDQVSLKVYIDGSLEATPSLPSLNYSTNNGFSIGGWSVNDRKFDGQIDGVAIFNYPLSSSQITTLWGGGTSVSNPMALPSPPIAYYPLGKSAWNGNYLAENNAIGDYVFDFNGSSKIRCGTASTYNEFCLSAWIKKDSTAPNYAGIFGTRNSTAVQFPYLLSLDNTGKVRLIAGGNTSVLSDSAINNDTWYHVVGLGDGTNLKLYINGQLQTATATYTTQSANNDLVIGGQFDTDSSSLWVGEISNAQIWDTSLSSTEIETLYNNGSPIRTLSNIPQNSNIQGWWKLDASDTYDSSTGNWTIEDHAGSNDGTSSGMSQANLVQSDLQTVAPYSKYAMNFLGTDNDYIDCGNSALTAISGGSTTLTTTMTISTWFKLGSSSASKGLVGFGDLNNNYGGLAIRHESGVFSFLRSNQHMVSGGYSFSDTTNWHNMVFVYDPNSASNCKVYIDSVNVNLSFVNVGDVSLENKKLTIGAYYGLSDTFTGELSNFSTWNAALTSAQVSEIYNEGLPSNLNSHSAYSNLVSWWQLGENSSFTGGWIFADEKGSNNGDGQNMTEAKLTNGVGTTANGVSSGMSEGNLVGDAPYSTANAISSGMSVVSRVTDVAPTPPLLLDDYGTDALLAESMRKLRTNYTGFSMRIQRRGTAGSTGTADDQADLHFDSNDYTSLDSPITAVTSGVLSTTLGEFCAAPGYSNPDSMPSADTVEVVKFYNQTQNTAITQFSGGSFQLNELVTNGVLETITRGGSTFVALNCAYRENYAVVPGTSVMGGTPLSTFTVTNVKDPAGGFTFEGVSITPTAYNIPASEILYDDTTDQLELNNSVNSNQILSSTNTFATDTPYLFSVLIQDAPDTTAYYVNNTLQASRTNFTHPNKSSISGIKYDQNNKAAGPEFMEAIYYNGSKETDLSSINQNIINYYNLT